MAESWRATASVLDADAAAPASARTLALSNYGRAPRGLAPAMRRLTSACSTEGVAITTADTKSRT
jgi:hypothetical protein